MTDRKFIIATGPSRHSKRWVNEETTWAELCKRLSKKNSTNETHAQYMKMSKADQDNIKDIGGFVGGTLSSHQRKKENVTSRSLLTLDLDNPTPDFLSDIALDFSNAAFIYSTHKHTPEHPRLRFIAPFSRDVTPLEYEAIARKVADSIGINMCDPTTYDINRMMYWPSSSSDIEQVALSIPGPFINPDKVLASYSGDWHNQLLWPTGDDEIELHSPTKQKAEDPLTKPGWIGAFCRTYTIQEAIEKYLPDVYTPTEAENRYTYAPGSTTGGAVVYDDKFIYSNHATDPASLMLCNAYDMVRIHKFGSMDEGISENAKKKPSIKAMNELCQNDSAVAGQAAKDHVESAQEDFSANAPDDDSDDPTDWITKCKWNYKGNTTALDNTINNFYNIIVNDPQLANIGGLNRLSAMATVNGPVPWYEETKEPRNWADADDSGLRQYIEGVYHINNKSNCLDALITLQNQRSFDPLQDYLKSLTWDGKRRVDTLLIDYLGAADNDYTRAVTRKTLVGAVARALHPGIKFDTMLTLTGPQGTGKSTLVRKLGKEWYTDTINDISGKNGYEAIRGKWLVEMSELTATRKADVEAVKQFISKQTDAYRPAFGRNVQEFPRHCIFIGTTNEKDFLRDRTGNRRYWVVETNDDDPLLSVFDMDDATVDQIWAEAVQLYNNGHGESIYLDHRIAAMALEVQNEHQEQDARTGLIVDYLKVKLPANWDDMDTEGRRDFLGTNPKNEGDPIAPKSDKTGTVERTRVCALEILVECFGKDLKQVKGTSDVREINQIMDSLPGWERIKGSVRFGRYGKQRGFQKVRI